MVAVAGAGDQRPATPVRRSPPRGPTGGEVCTRASSSEVVATTHPSARRPARPRARRRAVPRRETGQGPRRAPAPPLGVRQVAEKSRGCLAVTRRERAEGAGREPPARRSPRISRDVVARGDRRAEARAQMRVDEPRRRLPRRRVEAEERGRERQQRQHQEQHDELELGSSELSPSDPSSQGLPLPIRPPEFLIGS